MSVEVGQTIDGKYRILRAIGEGGMGAVYEAEHIMIGRKVAVKVLHPHVAEQEDCVTRFEREAQAAARIGNDHILEVLDVGSLPSGARYIVCEFLDGDTLASRLEAQTKLTPVEIVPIALQLLRGLGAAHAAGVVHRDLKPENIFLLRQKAGWTDFVKIIDFGISKFQALNGEAGMRMTATGIVMGTSYYLSPEQARGTEEADHRSDLYTVGVILYEAATGVLPFDAESFNDLLFKIVLEKPRPPIEVVPEIDPAFSDLILKGMAREKVDRFQTAEEFAEALETWASQAGFVPTGPRMSLVSQSQMGNTGGHPALSRMTPGAWGGTQPPQRSPFAAEGKRKRDLLIAGAVGVGALVLVGAAFGIYAISSSPEDVTATAADAAVSAAPPPSATAPATAEPEIEEETVEPEPEPEPEPEAVASPPPAPAPRAAPQPQPRPRPVARPRPAPQPRPSPRPSRRDLGY